METPLIGNPAKICQFGLTAHHSCIPTFPEDALLSMTEAFSILRCHIPTLPLICVVVCLHTYEPKLTGGETGSRTQKPPCEDGDLANLCHTIRRPLLVNQSGWSDEDRTRVTRIKGAVQNHFATLHLKTGSGGGIRTPRPPSYGPSELPTALPRNLITLVVSNGVEPM